MKSLTNLKTTEYKLSSDKITISDLAAGSSYILCISAKNSSNTIAFCSTNKIFTTEQKNNLPSGTAIEFGDKTKVEPFIPIDKIYVNDNESFKQVIVYKNT